MLKYMNSIYLSSIYTDNSIYYLSKGLSQIFIQPNLNHTKYWKYLHITDQLLNDNISILNSKTNIIDHKFYPHHSHSY